MIIFIIRIFNESIIEITLFSRITSNRVAAGVALNHTKMAAKSVYFTLVCLAVAVATPLEPVKTTRNKIFFEETLDGEVFENVDIFESQGITLFNNEENPYRLPTTTRPERYTIIWSTDFDTLSFAGSVSIQLHATEANVNEIVLHSSDLNLATVVLSLNGVVVPTTYTTEEEYHFLKVQLQSGTLIYNSATPVTYVLDINFEAPMRSDMYGIYRSWFKTGNETRWMASTQFQATSARRAFPCYDEPSFKAYFDITLRRPAGYKSWSCTRIAQTTNSTIQGYEDDQYHTTPYMSTYLIAIIVAEYSSIEALGSDGLLMHEVIARPDAIANGQGEYALEVGQELLVEMSEHTAMDFYSINPNLKMTQASIPDFSAGAMENWGLLTYREAYLMYDEEHTTDNFKQIIARILSHEIAHMWFGNLVTCDWWDVLWLNEGFARYYQYFLTHWVEEYMDLQTRFITEQVHTALLSDSSNSPHALTNPGVGSPAAVSAMFSTLSYNKGAAVIRMTEHLLGFNVHREGLRNYLSQFSFNVSLPVNLFQSLQDAAVAAGAISEYGSGFSVIDYYESFTAQPGVPVLNVQVNHATGDMTIQQRRFNINTGYSSVNTNWIVPINFASASNSDFENTKPTHIISEAISVINRGSVGDEWVVLNKQQTGYYRVNYDDYTWNLIIIALRGSDRTLIHEYNRAQIVDDVFQFARSGLMSYNRAFNILSFLENETEYAPWAAAVTGFNWIRNRLGGTESLAAIDSLIQRWATNIMNDLGYVPAANDTFMREYLRSLLAPIMCSTNYAPCRAAAVQQYAALTTAGNEVPKNNRLWVYCNALRDGTEADFNFLWNRFQTHHVYTEKIVILQSIGCTPHANSLNTFLDGIVQENELVRPQDYTTALNTAVTGNEVNTQIVFSYIQQNLAAVSNAFNGLTTPLSYVSARLRSQQEINNFRTWATNNQAVLGTAYQSIYNGAENSVYNLEWVASNSAELAEYVVNGDDNIAASTPAAEIVTDPATEAQPELEEPVTPNIPDSAVTSVLSVIALVFAIAANVVA